MKTTHSRRVFHTSTVVFLFFFRYLLCNMTAATTLTGRKRGSARRQGAARRADDGEKMKNNNRYELCLQTRSIFDRVTIGVVHALPL